MTEATTTLTRADTLLAILSVNLVGNIYTLLFVLF